MIKFIATDLDGTLLKNSSATPTEEDFDAIRRLQERNVIFCAASGRQYSNLRRLFAPVWEDMLFICENGTYLVYKDETLSVTAMPQNETLQIIDDINSFEGCEALISTRYTCFVNLKDRTLLEPLFYNWNIPLSNCSDPKALNIPITKVSLFRASGVDAAFAAPLEKRWGKSFHVAISGTHWLDFTSATKGDAIITALRRFNLKKEEAAAFGDNFNDIEMLDEVGYPFVMEHAPKEIHMHGRYRCQSVAGELNAILKNNLQPKNGKE